MEPIAFKEANSVLRKPPNMTDEECSSLHIFTDGKCCISKWKLSDEEIEHCKEHGFIWVSVLSGSTQPPVSIFAEETAFEEEV